ncbi:helix-turn-helix domain-containing protein [Enterococcus faecalis]|uniref:helix-turn-helix domain-containing protein n=1 Tax=Enterococcus faecalis TaxID=1351 RepID=UPI00067D4E09|nr:helix-turn-helix domain-containing protein [Enterococcus faecalis]EGO9051640.1 helix-turn-helix domain-containing protein [Enterococcus faecalis]EHH3130695.1 helix-turn-helix domain-containing protein [Enterococcus faecalis]EHS2085480.1 helix-turn-helix domain-containing protein [Enterococcus faecalis]HAP2777966.1 helix-turn-helix domain-containing protein [Enterococcus faecalis]
MNRIKTARQRKGISQKELADRLAITQQAISYYENGSRTPDENMWTKISHILTVPVEYLTGITDDPDGWDLWEENTGYSIQEIKNEIERMKKANHIVGNTDDLQNLIGQAVANLSGHGNTDRGIIDSIALSINKLQSDLTNRYEDPKKLSMLPNLGDGQLKIRPGSTKTSELIFDDLSVEAYERALDVLIQARRDLQNISNDLLLK